MRPRQLRFLIGLAILLLPCVPSTARAQTPATVHTAWTPNPAAEAVTQYQVTLDAGAPIVTLPAACSPTLCTQLVTVAAFGLHTLSVTACNVKIVGDPTSLECSAPSTVSFTLGVVPSVVLALKVVN